MTHWQLHHGKCSAVLPTLPDNSVESVVTDPPYELGFMGRAWDRSGIANDPAMWAEVLRVLKPGAYLVSFGGSRTYHRMACAIEDAGFVIKDSLQWIYGSGFPKSLNLGEGVGTALKPAHEPIVLAQKPLQGTYAANLARWGVGGLNIDGCRIGLNGERPSGSGKRDSWRELEGRDDRQDWNGGNETSPLGRWPANVLLDEDAAALLDAMSGTLTSGGKRGGETRQDTSEGGYEGWPRSVNGFTHATHGDTGGASRFFYCAKASRSERDAGLADLPLVSGAAITDSKEGSARLDSPRTGAGRTSGGRNTHPTVKPLTLMRWLVRLVTPEGGTVLDPFAGSGTTLCAAIHEGRDVIGIEMTVDYLPLIRGRAEHAAREVAQRTQQAVLPLGAA